MNSSLPPVLLALAALSLGAGQTASRAQSPKKRSGAPAPGSTALVARGETVYVAPNGNDRWSGRFPTANKARTDGPFATVERARDEIRLRRKQRGGALPPRGVQVELAGGVYELKQPFALESGDSGTAQAPIEYRARAGEAARLVGGPRITGWKPVTDPATLTRLDPSARGKVWQASLATLGLPSPLPDTEGSAQWGQSRPGVELFFQNKPMTLARWPNAPGEARVADIVGSAPVDNYGARGAKEGKIIYAGDRPARWVGEKDVWVHGFWALDWADQRQRVESIDTEKRVITLAKPDHEWGYRTNQWYYACNILSELDQPGEWYLDRAAQVVYFWPTAPLEKGDVLLSVLPGLVSLQNVSHVTLRGLTLEAARGTGVTVDGGERVRISGCTIRNVGSWGARLTGAKNSGVVGCDISETGDGGIDLDGGDRKTLTPGGLYAENNHIHHYSRWNPVYNAGVRLGGVGGRVSHNLIHDAPHLAIGLLGNDHVIERNEIHSVVQNASDAGVIYAGQDWTMRGNVIRYNYLHHVYGREARGCMGVYLDDNFSSALIYGNVFQDVPRSVFLGGGRDNVVANNVFLDCAPAVNVDGRGLEWRASGITDLTRRLEALPYQSEPWRSRYPELLTLLTDEPMAPKGTVIARNVLVGGKWSNITREATPYVVQQDNFTEGDPLFANAAKGNFALQKTSPLRKLSFKPIPPRKNMGLYASPERASWPPAPNQVQPKPTPTTTPK